MNKKVKLATVFSGIGAVEFAFKRLGIETEIIFACDNGERDIEYDIEAERAHVNSLPNFEEKKKYVDELYNKKTRKTNFVEKSYTANYLDGKSNKFYQDVILLDGKDFKDKVDLFVGGSPCQSFSSVGHQGGLEDVRGTLFYEFARLVQEIEPKVFIYENVRNLLKHDNGNTWKTIKKIFDSLGYKYYFDVLNACEHGMPQNRRRLFVVGFKDNSVEFSMPKPRKTNKLHMSDFLLSNSDYGCITSGANGKIEIKKKPGQIDGKYILSPKLYNYVMCSGTKTWYQKPAINLPIARTLLKTMGNRHRAGVDNYVSEDKTDNLGSVRMLTEIEAHRLMGFTDDYQIVVSKAQAYKQAGNSIVVDVLIDILKQIDKTGVLEEE